MKSVTDEMKVQVLLSTMHQMDHIFLDTMNIQTDAIVINQCSGNRIENIEHRNRMVQIMSYADERGIGLSRNTALVRAYQDFALFADDDEVFVDGYEQIIIQAFKNNPKADIIIFNVPSTNEDRPSPHIEKSSRVRRYNCLRYGTYHICVRTKKVHQSRLGFTLLFGGGARYGSGEDSLFLVDALKHKLKIYTCPSVIAVVHHVDSTWFNGYDKKFFYDKGAFYAAISPFAHLLSLVQLFRHRNEYCANMSFKAAYLEMVKGIHEYQAL